jgi:hypothetical protein
VWVESRSEAFSKSDASCDGDVASVYFSILSDCNEDTMKKTVIREVNVFDLRCGSTEKKARLVLRNRMVERKRKTQTM